MKSDLLTNRCWLTQMSGEKVTKKAFGTELACLMLFVEKIGFSGA